jgi:RNase P protein component
MNQRHRLPGRRRIAAVRETGIEARFGVIRVRARRRLRAAIAPVLLEHPGLDMVVSLPGRATEMPFLSLRAGLATALASASRSSQARVRA